MCETASFLEVLRRDGHVRDPQARLFPLNGGVSSEIYLVEDGPRKFVVKRALPKLRVKDDWFVDVGRNASERDYLECVGRMMPGVVPQLHFSSPDAGYFGMEYLGEGFANWKQMLLAGKFRTHHADQAGRILGEIHRRTAGDQKLLKQFDTTHVFHQIRVEPYLLTTGDRHPALRTLFHAEARRIEATREALVHGDFSPKNILIQGDRMVLLDCEVAWFGDPVFDVAFFLNHLFLKALHCAPQNLDAAKMVDAFWRAYARERSADDAAQIEERLRTLLPMLLLARVDGKSPVEYLTAPKQEFIRSFVGKHLSTPPKNLAALKEIWLEEIAATEFIEAHA
jgi:5-methylthioribose kinase